MPTMPPSWPGRRRPRSWCSAPPRPPAATWPTGVASTTARCSWNDDASRVALQMGNDQLTLRSRFLHAASDLAKAERRRPVAAGRLDRGRPRPRADELASTGYSNLASLDVEQRRFRAAEHVLRGVAALHGRARHPDLPALADRRPVPAAPRAGSLERRSRGRRNGARRRRDAPGDALAPRGRPRSCRCVVASRSRPTALDAAWELAGRSTSRCCASRCSRPAERAWTTGDPDARVTEAAAAAAGGVRRRPGRRLGGGDLAVWLRALGSAGRCDGPRRPPSRSGSASRAATSRQLPGGGAPATRSRRRWRGATPPSRPTGPRASSCSTGSGAVGTADRRRAELRRDGIARCRPSRARARAPTPAD